MAVVSSLSWILGLFLAVAIAPQLRIWTWGPAMLCFAVAAAAAAPQLWKERRNPRDGFLVGLGFVLLGWIGVRAILSPAYEASRSDLLLLSMAASAFLTLRASFDSGKAQGILVFGIAAILAANIGVICMQVSDPSYSPVFPNETARLPGGFFAHYSYGAAFLIPCSLLLAGFALFSKWHPAPRTIIGLVSLAGMAAVYFTKSRGGFVGMGAGAVVLVFATLFVGGRDKRRWFGPGIVIVPVTLAVLGVLFFSWLSQVQQARGGEGNLAGMLDSNIRLYLMGIALSCIGAHPLAGGGSRSFSWECFRFWDTEAMGWGKAKPEHVHNELLQTATDYGIIGASILLAFLLCAFLVASLRLATGKSPGGGRQEDAWRVGGLAALAGLLTHSNFEGIFRIPPGAAMLGLCLAAICMPATTADEGSPRIRPGSLLLAALSVALAAHLAFFGWKGSAVSRILWPSHFSQAGTGLETKADALSQAIAIWPLPSLYLQRANTRRELAGREPEGAGRDELLGLSLADLRRAGKLNPYDPEIAIGTANILSVLGRNPEAEAEFRRAIGLQGEMEPAFFARTLFARHLCRKGYAEIRAADPLAALGTFQLAAEQTDWIVELFGHNYSTEENLRIHVGIHQGLGLSFEMIGDAKAAIAEYDRAAALPHGTSSNYFAGMLYGRKAVEAWSERESSDALRLFIEAEARIRQATESPASVTPESRAEYEDYIRKSIGYLRGAKVIPSEKIDF